MKATISLPFPPTVNTYWRSVFMHGGVRVLLSAKGRAYREAVQALVTARWPRLRPLEDRLAVDIIVHPPDARRRDLDNLLKGPLDALTSAGVWADDALLDGIVIRRGPAKPGGELVVTIARVPDPQKRLALSGNDE